MLHCSKRITAPLAVIAFVSLSLFSPRHILAQSCGNQPASPMVWAKSGPGGGQVTLHWNGVSEANRYAVAYGTQSNEYVYGADRIGEESSRVYTVNGLMPGKTYYFRLAAAHDSCSSPFSTEVKAVAGGGAQTEASPTGNVMQSTPQTSSVSFFSGPVGKQKLWVKSGPGTGEVTLYWQQGDSEDNYHLVYGTNAAIFEYGALNIGHLSWFTVRGLRPGATYHFALVPVMGGNALYTTESVSTHAGGAASTVQAMLVPEPEPIEATSMMQEDEEGFTGGAQRLGSPVDSIEDQEDEFYLESGEKVKQSQSGDLQMKSLAVETDQTMYEDLNGYYTEDGIFHAE